MYPETLPIFPAGSTGRDHLFDHHYMQGIRQTSLDRNLDAFSAGDERVYL